MFRIKRIGNGCIKRRFVLPCLTAVVLANARQRYWLSNNRALPGSLPQFPLVALSTPAVARPLAHTHGLGRGGAEGCRTVRQTRARRRRHGRRLLGVVVSAAAAASHKRRPPAVRATGKCAGRSLALRGARSPASRRCWAEALASLACSWRSAEPACAQPGGEAPAGAVQARGQPETIAGARTLFRNPSLRRRPTHARHLAPAKPASGRRPASAARPRRRQGEAMRLRAATLGVAPPGCCWRRRSRRSRSSHPKRLSIWR